MTAFKTGILRLGLCLLAGACITTAQNAPAKAPQGGQPATAKPESAEGPKQLPGTGVPVGVDPKAYVLGAEDVVAIRVWREPDLSGPQAIRPDGKITLPMVGEVQAGGLSPEQLSETLTKRFSEFINRPEIVVTVQAVRSKRYYITGEVNRPGVFPLPVPTTVLEALTQAGGFRDFSNPKKITIMRGDKRIKFNYKEVIKGKNLAQNILLESGDYIVVP
jgi:polysaccharide biosynthesis/export protein